MKKLLFIALCIVAQTAHCEPETSVNYRFLAIKAHLKFLQLVEQIEELKQKEWSDPVLKDRLDKEAYAYYFYGLAANPDIALDAQNGRIFYPNWDESKLGKEQWEKIEKICSIQVNGQTIPEVVQAKVNDVCVRNSESRMCKNAQKTLAGIKQCLAEIEKNKNT